MHCTIARASQEHLELQAYLSQMTLVRAEVVAIEDVVNGRSISRQTVRHVYCGSDAAVGDSFIESSSVGHHGDSIGSAIVPALEVGETGIWLLWRKNGVLGRKSSGGWGIEYPVRPRFAERYAHAETVAHAAETTWREPTEVARLRRVHSLLTDDSQQVRIWAITVLAATHPSVLHEHVANWKEHAHAVSVLIHLDEVLCERREGAEAWRQSDARNEMLAVAVESGMRDHADLPTIMQHLGAMAQRKRIDPERMLALVEPIAADPAFEHRIRAQAIGLLRFIVNDAACSHRVIDLTIGVLETDHAQPVRDAALATLRDVRQVSKDQHARLTALHDEAILREQRAPGDSSIPPERQPAAREAAALGEIVRRITSE